MRCSKCNDSYVRVISSVGIENKESKSNCISVTKDRVTKLSTKLLSKGRYINVI